jgi:ribose 5-phosphate isomerase
MDGTEKLMAVMVGVLWFAQTQHVKKCGVVGVGTGGTNSKNLTKLNYNTVSTGVKLPVACPFCYLVSAYV